MHRFTKNLKHYHKTIDLFPTPHHTHNLLLPYLRPTSKVNFIQDIIYTIQQKVTEHNKQNAQIKAAEAESDIVEA